MMDSSNSNKVTIISCNLTNEEREFLYKLGILNLRALENASREDIRLLPFYLKATMPIFA